MRAKQAKYLRKKAEEDTVGQSAKVTRRVYKRYKRNFKKNKGEI